MFETMRSADRLRRASPKGTALPVVITLTFTSTALAQDATPAAETAYIFNSLSFLMHGFLVMFMAAGFCMLEAGLVRKRSVATQLLKNVALYSLAGIMFYLVGYNLMYMGVDGDFLGSFALWRADDSAALAETSADFSGGYAASSDWFFQMVFVAATASIVSGAMAERVRVWPFLAFAAVLTGILYPISGSWHWGGGWLNEMGFSDFAGSTIVHSVGGWAALAGIIVLGARKGKYDPDRRVNPMLGSSLPLATIGTFILWLGWFGFNGGSQLAMGSAADVVAIANIYINTNMAACGGVLTAMALSEALYKKIDITMVLNGALAGLVSITAEPLAPTPGISIAIGAVGGALVVLAVPLLDKMKLDDVVGAIPVHLVAGIWGTLAVPFSNENASFVTQLIGVAAYGAFTFIASLILWSLLKTLIGIRLTEEDETIGIDQAELGMEAYPEFGPGIGSAKA